MYWIILKYGFEFNFHFILYIVHSYSPFKLFGLSLFRVYYFYVIPSTFKLRVNRKQNIIPGNDKNIDCAGKILSFSVGKGIDSWESAKKKLLDVDIVK